MLNVLTIHTKKIIKGHKDLYRDNEYICYLDLVTAA